MARGLTPLQVENAKPNPNKRKEIPDPGKLGLYLVIQPSGKKSWAVRYRRLSDKQPRKYTLEGFPSLKVARKLAQDVLDQVAEGADPAAHKQVEKVAKRTASDKESDAFGNVAIRFIKRDQKPSNRTWKETARLLGLREGKDEQLEIIKGGLVDRWGQRPVQEITKREIIDVIDAIDERGAGVMANRTLAAIRRMFNWCVEKDILARSPCEGIKPPADENSRRRVLTDDEIRLFWKSCDKVSHPFGHAGKLLLLTGARRSEVTEMTRHEVRDDQWTIPRERSKNNEPHTVPLSRAAAEVLAGVRKIKSDAGYVFTTTGETAVSGWSKAKLQMDKFMLEAAREKNPKAKIEEWRLHDLRRTVASGMAKLSIKLEVIEKCLNHVSGSFAGIVGVYQLHNYEDAKREAFDVWAKAVEKLVSGRSWDQVVKERKAEIEGKLERQANLRRA